MTLCSLNRNLEWKVQSRILTLRWGGGGGCWGRSSRPLDKGPVSPKKFFGPSDLSLVETPRAPPLDPPLKCKRALQIPIINLELLLFPKGWGVPARSP